MWCIHNATEIGIKGIWNQIMLPNNPNSPRPSCPMLIVKHLPLDSSENYLKSEQRRVNDQLDTVGRRKGRVLVCHNSNLGSWVNGGIHHQDKGL